MTICLCSVISSDAIGGANTFNRHFIEIFPKQGQTLLFLTIGKEADAQKPDMMHTDGQFKKVVLNKSYFKRLQEFRKYFRPGGSNAPGMLAAGYAMREWLLEHHERLAIDCIEVSDGGGLGIFLADTRLPPVVLGGHGSNLQISRYDHTAYDEHGSVLKLLEGLSYRHCDGIVTHCHKNKKDLASFASIPIYVSKIPFEPGFLPPCTETAHGIVTGSLRVFKGPQLLLDALQVLLQKNDPVIMNWVGADSKSFKGYKSAAGFLQQRYPDVWNTAFFWKGAQSREKARESMSAAKFVVVPSLWETFSYVSLEAAAMGKAILVTDTTGASELFTDGINAVVVPCAKDSLADGLRQLDADPSLRKTLGGNACSMIAGEFQPSDIVKSRLAIYDEMKSSGRAPKPGLEESLDFLKRYLTNNRKMYFGARSIMKKWYLVVTGKKTT